VRAYNRTRSEVNRTLFATRRHVAIGHLEGLAIDVRRLGLDATLYAHRRPRPALLVGDGVLAEWVEAAIFQFWRYGSGRAFGSLDDPASAALAIKDWLATNRKWGVS
jgi:hypothetical protein